MLPCLPADNLILADASVGDYAAGGLGGVLLLGVPAVGAWIRSLIKDRAEARTAADKAKADAAEKAARLAIEVETSRANLERTARSDAALQWQTYSQESTKQLREEIARVNEESSGRAKRMNDELKARDARIEKLEEAEKDCQKERKDTAVTAARQEEQIKGLHGELRRLFAHVGGGVPGVTQPTFITASAEDGIIVAATAQVGPMFHWTQQEIVGQNIEVLIPPELREGHRAGFSAVARGEQQVDPEKIISTTAMRRNGERFPVLIVLTSWISKASGKRFIGAEIKDDVFGAGPLPGRVELAGPDRAEKKEGC